MHAPPSWRAPPRRRKRLRRDAAIGLALCAALLIWAASTQLQIDVHALLQTLRAYEHLALDVQIVAAVLLIVAAAQITGFDRYLWHMMANATVLEKPRAVRDVWVIDGDTIDGDGVRYRLANIDAPETGDGAKCFRERERGEEAKRAAIALVRGAPKVEVRRTWRTDIYGRRVAFVLVDGVDLGRQLVARAGTPVAGQAQALVRTTRRARGDRARGR